MHWWRISKYDPRFRDGSGRYLRDEWIGAGQIGQVCGGTLLTEEEYLRVESLYVAAVLLCWKASGAPALEIRALETSAPFGLPAQQASLADVGFGAWRPRDGELVATSNVLTAMVRWCLRELGWCELAADGFELAFGYDFYVSVGSVDLSAAAREAVTASGLFIEAVAPSPG